MYICVYVYIHIYSIHIYSHIYIYIFTYIYIYIYARGNLGGGVALEVMPLIYTAFHNAGMYIIHLFVRYVYSTYYICITYIYMSHWK